MRFSARKFVSAWLAPSPLIYILNSISLVFPLSLMHPDVHVHQQQQGELPISSIPPVGSACIALVLPTPRMQSQIHELAKSLPPPRKQNTACDACRSGSRSSLVVRSHFLHRSRKVKCHRLSGQDKVSSVFRRHDYHSHLPFSVPGNLPCSLLYIWFSLMITASTVYPKTTLARKFAL